MSSNNDISKQSASIEAFLEKASRVPAPLDSNSVGKLVFAMDATASREACWDMACQTQADMFSQTSVIGKLQIQLCYYCGYEQFYASEWTQNAPQLQQIMASVRCKSGQTQLKRVIDHTVSLTKSHKINALVFVGDCMEEVIEDVLTSAGQLALKGIPVFLFHEGNNQIAESTFRRIANMTNGAYCKFDQSSADQLRNLLNAVAIFAVGGLNALRSYAKHSPSVNNTIVKQLTDNS